MKQEPRLVIRMGKQLGWAHKLGGTVSRDLQDGSMLARLMESQIWHPPVGSVGGGCRRGTMASACLNARHFNFFLYTTGAFQAAALVLELRGSETE